MSPKLLTESLRRKICESLDPLVPAGVRCAIVDFPDHGNVGDSLIWCGEMAYLEDRDAKIVYIATEASFDPIKLMQSHPELLLIHGGGNFGDLYPHHQKLREAVLTVATDCKVVQFPQSVFFESDAAFKKSMHVFSEHENLVVLTRDRESNAALQEAGIDARMCPDMALYLTLPTMAPAKKPTLILKRTDPEAREDTVNTSIDTTDWSTDPSDLLSFCVKLTHRLAVATDALLGTTLQIETFQIKARWRVKRGMNLLSRYQTITTDRLHVAVMTMQLNRNVVCVENSYGKLGRVLSAFSITKSEVPIVDNFETALAYISEQNEGKTE